MDIKKSLTTALLLVRTIEVWPEMLQNMKSRGLKQVELSLSDGVVGMKTALARTYPKTHFQRCLVHVMRNICAKVRVDDRYFNRIHKGFGQVQDTLESYFD